MGDPQQQNYTDPNYNYSYDQQQQQNYSNNDGTNSNGYQNYDNTGQPQLDQSSYQQDNSAGYNNYNNNYQQDGSNNGQGYSDQANYGYSDNNANYGYDSGNNNGGYYQDPNNNNGYSNDSGYQQQTYDQNNNSNNTYQQSSSYDYSNTSNNNGYSDNQGYSSNPPVAAPVNDGYATYTLTKPTEPGYYQSEGGNDPNSYYNQPAPVQQQQQQPAYYSGQTQQYSSPPGTNYDTGYSNNNNGYISEEYNNNYNQQPVPSVAANVSYNNSNNSNGNNNYYAPPVPAPAVVEYGHSNINYSSGYYSQNNDDTYYGDDGNNNNNYAPQPLAPPGAVVASSGDAISFYVDPNQAAYPTRPIEGVFNVDFGLHAHAGTNHDQKPGDYVARFHVEYHTPPELEVKETQNNSNQNQGVSIGQAIERLQKQGTMIRDGTMIRENTIRENTMIREGTLFQDPNMKKDNPKYYWQMWCEHRAEQVTLRSVPLTIAFVGRKKNSDPFPIALDMKPGESGKVNVRIPTDRTGDLEKVRIKFDESAPREIKWEISKLFLKNQATNEMLAFIFPKTILNKGTKDSMVEGSRRGDPCYTYEIEVYPADRPGLYFEDVKATILLKGSNGDTGERLFLDAVADGELQLERGKCLSFCIMAVDIGEINTIVLGHNKGNMKTAEFVQKIVARPSHQTNDEFVVTFEKVVTDDDWKFWWENKESQVKYKAVEVYFTFAGETGQSEEMTLTTSLAPGELPIRHDVSFNGSDTGPVTKVRIRFGDTVRYNTKWDIDKLHMIHLKTDKKLTFQFDKQFVRQKMTDPTIEASCSGLALIKMVAEFHIDDRREMLPPGVIAKLMVRGTKGDTGNRTVYISDEAYALKRNVQPGEIFSFELDAVDVGEVIGVVFTHNKKGRKTAEFVQRIVVRHLNQRNAEFIATFDKVIPDDEWRLWWVNRDTQVNYPGVELGFIFIGEKAETGELALKVPFYPGELKKQEVQFSREAIGLMKKVRIRFGSVVAPGTKWEVDKLYMHHMRTGIESVFQFTKPAIKKEMGDSTVEASCDGTPITVNIVEFYVGDRTAMLEKDVVAKLRIRGTKGETGKRIVYVASEAFALQKQLTPYDVYQFEIEVVDLGDIVGAQFIHNKPALSAPDFIQKVLIRPVHRPGVEYIFDYGDKNNRIQLPTMSVEMANSRPNRQVKKTAAPQAAAAAPAAPAPPKPALKQPAKKVTIVDPPAAATSTAPKKEVKEVKKEPKKEEPAAPSTPSKPVTNVDPVTEADPREWIMWWTNEETQPVDSLEVSVILIGTRGETPPYVFPVDLAPGDSREYKLFVNNDVGDLKTLRFGHGPKVVGEHPWYVKEVRTRHVKTGIVNKFDFGKMKEAKKAADNVPVAYRIQTFMLRSAGQVPPQAELYIKLKGMSVTTDKVWLNRSLNNPLRFLPGRMDIFEVGNVPDVGDIANITFGGPVEQAVSTFRQGLEKVVVTPLHYKKKEEFTFNFGENKPLLSRSNTMVTPAPPTRSGTMVAPNQPPQQQRPVQYQQQRPVPYQQQPQSQPRKVNAPAPATAATPAAPKRTWIVKLKTGAFKKSTTQAALNMVVCGPKRSSEIVSLKQANGFAPDQIYEFKLDFSDVEDVFKIRLGFDSLAQKPALYIEELALKALNGPQYVFTVGAWIWADSSHDTWREFLAKKSKYQLKVYKYQLAVWTGQGSGTNGTAYVEIIGTSGDTGKRRLAYSKSHVKQFAANQMDLFDIEAIDVGDVRKLNLTYVTSDASVKWHVTRMLLQLYPLGGEECVFECNRQLDLVDRTATFNVATRKPGKPYHNLSDEDYLVFVSTGRETGGPLLSTVSLTLIGDKGTAPAISLVRQAPSIDSKAGPMPLFAPGGVDVFPISVPVDIVGKVLKARIEHNNMGTQRKWFLDKFALQSLAKPREPTLHFDITRWLAVSEDDGDIVRECPASYLGQSTAVPMRYEVTIECGPKTAPTLPPRAFVHVVLLGKMASMNSGQRLLQKTTKGTPFLSPNMQSTFSVSAVGVGEVTKVILGHNSNDYLLDVQSVSVHWEKPKEGNITFAVNKYLVKLIDSKDAELVLTN